MWQIEEIVARIEADKSAIGRMSCGETIAAAFLFNRMDLLPEMYMHPAAALARLGSNWADMVAEYNREHGDLELK